jgi:hypothetical protein
MEEITQTYPCFYRTTKSGFASLDSQANELLGFPNSEASNYCNPIIDINGAYFFTVNPEVVSLFTQSQLDSCIPYDEIVLPPPPPIG